jgi:hypothetical protein
LLLKFRKKFFLTIFFLDDLKDLFSFGGSENAVGCQTHDLLGCDCDGDGQNVKRQNEMDEDSSELSLLFS